MFLLLSFVLALGAWHAYSMGWYAPAILATVWGVFFAATSLYYLARDKS